MVPFASLSNDGFKTNVKKTMLLPTFFLEWQPLRL